MGVMRLLPEPRVVRLSGGSFALAGDIYVVLQEHGATRDMFAAERFVIEAEDLTGVGFHLARGEGVDAGREIRVVFDEGVGAEAREEVREQVYRLTIGEKGIDLAGRGAAGIFYGFQTLMQVVREAVRHEKGKKGKKVKLPCLVIEDWPDFVRRGVYHDTARGKVPTVDTLLQLIDDLGHLKYNEFQLYVENNFEFRRYPAMYDDTDPLTAEELMLLDAACRARHMDFVPSLTSLGHFEKILSRPEYRHLAEAEPAALKAMGAASWVDQPWSLCVTDPEAKGFLKGMYEEFVPQFSSGRFNICCDEAYDLGKVRSKEMAEKIGVGQMYVDWVNYCAGLAKGHGKGIQMWGDIILNHPELIGQLPGDAVLLEWGYESHHKFDEHCATFAERIGEGGGKAVGRSFYVAPGTASWLSFGSRTRNALGNIHAAAVAGMKHGAEGILVTDWGDNGHQQMLAASMVAFAYGAAAGWNVGSVRNPAIAEAPNWETGKVPAGTREADRGLASFLEGASVHLFGDGTGKFAGLAYELGLTYERFSWQRFNGSLEWFLFREKWDFANYVNRAEVGDLRKVTGACEKLRRGFEGAKLKHPEAGKIKGEMVFTCEEIGHTCKRTELRKAWLAADPGVRNPEHEVLRGKPARPLPKTFRAEMGKLRMEAGRLKKAFKTLWMARNKKSRVEDVVVEFERLEGEYRRFGRG